MEKKVWGKKSRGNGRYFEEHHSLYFYMTYFANQNWVLAWFCLRHAYSNAVILLPIFSSGSESSSSRDQSPYILNPALKNCSVGTNCREGTKKKDHEGELREKNTGKKVKHNTPKHWATFSTRRDDDLLMICHSFIEHPDFILTRAGKNSQCCPAQPYRNDTLVFHSCPVNFIFGSWYIDQVFYFRFLTRILMWCKQNSGERTISRFAKIIFGEEVKAYILYSVQKIQFEGNNPCSEINSDN